MKTAITGTALIVSLLLTGCEKKANPSSPTPSAAAPVAQPALVSWQQGDKPAAINRFAEINWNARPLFASDSPLSLSEAQFIALSEAERKAKSEEILAQLDTLKKLAGAVAESGRAAAAKGDVAQARKYFSSLKGSGEALAGPDCMAVVQLVGKALKKMADAELAKVP
ncbi:MAG TPA: hypothetical protein VEC99_04670 [Clostridia bacterium]|nr:hypothetical protein [Clostridia bacterium]